VLEVRGPNLGKTRCFPVIEARIDGERYFVSMLEDYRNWVLGILHRAEHPVTVVKLQFAPEGLRELAEGKLIASGRPLEHGRCHASDLPMKCHRLVSRLS
jgi:hypothetical protein